MVSESTLIISIVGAVFASTGFWAFLTSLIQSKKSKDSAEGQMLKGLGHDRICYLGECYIQRGYITNMRTCVIIYTYRIKNWVETVLPKRL